MAWISESELSGSTKLIISEKYQPLPRRLQCHDDHIHSCRYHSCIRATIHRPRSVSHPRFVPYEHPNPDPRFRTSILEANLQPLRAETYLAHLDYWIDGLQYWLCRKSYLCNTSSHEIACCIFHQSSNRD